VRRAIALGVTGCAVALTIAIVLVSPAGAACSGTQLSPGADVKAAVANAPGGTTFCLAPGVYNTSEVNPKDGDSLVGPGAILDGGHTEGRAIANYNHASNVTLSGLEVRNYANTYGPEDGAIGAWFGSGWLLGDLWVHNNAASAVLISESTGLRLTGSLLDHNGCGGIMGGGTGAVVTGNEIAFNNTGGNDGIGYSCGGGKFGGVNPTFTDNNSHDNNGYGIWFDGRNTGELIVGNTFARNAGGGVLIEIGLNAQARVTNNYFAGNGMGYPNRVMFGAGVIVAATDHVEIDHNRFTATNAHAVTLDFTHRSDWPGLALNNISVHDNDIALRTDGTSPYSNIGRVGFYGPQSEPGTASFNANRYYFDDPAAWHFALHSVSADPYNLVTWAQWRAAGQDATSTLQPSAAFPTDPFPTPTPTTPAPTTPAPSPSATINMLPGDVKVMKCPNPGVLKTSNKNSHGITVSCV
jgi:hypothetical protein